LNRNIDYFKTLEQLPPLAKQVLGTLRPPGHRVDFDDIATELDTTESLVVGALTSLKRAQYGLLVDLKLRHVSVQAASWARISRDAEIVLETMDV